jgi:hypothetical protein
MSGGFVGRKESKQRYIRHPRQNARLSGMACTGYLDGSFLSWFYGVMFGKILGIKFKALVAVVRWPAEPPAAILISGALHAFTRNQDASDVISLTYSPLRIGDVEISSPYAPISSRDSDRRVLNPTLRHNVSRLPRLLPQKRQP